MDNDQSRPDRSRLIRGIVVYVILFTAILLISNIKAVNNWVGRLLAIVRPVTIGLVIAYIANPFFRFFERKLLVRIRYRYLRRVLALILTYALLFLIVALLIMLIVPQLVTSIQTFIANFDTNLARLIRPLNALIERINARLPLQEDGSQIIPYVDNARISAGMTDLWNYLVYLFREQIGFSSINRLLDFLSRAASGLTNLIFGLFLSIYLLFSKEKRYAQIMKFRRAVFKDSVNRRITHVCEVADRSFGGFLRGKVLDSLIVGVLTYLACRIFNIPYSLLVAAIVGITDIIPVIGPFIGVIPTAVIILLADPIKVIFFLISIVVIQQVDGNIIAPKILGENTGVSSLCVMIAIILMGGLWGFVGMLIGVPLFATVLELLDYWLERRLASRGLPNELENYYSPDTVGRKTESAIDRRRRKRAEKRKNHLASEDTGSGDLNLRERVRLRTYQIARKYHVFSDGTEEDLAAFLEEEKAMVREHTPDESAGETPAPVKEGLLEEILAEPAETPAPTEEGKGDGDHE